MTLEISLQALNSQNIGVNRIPRGKVDSNLFPFAASKKILLLLVSLFERFSTIDLLSAAISYSKPSEFEMILRICAVFKQIEIL
jgi:hypothetical protein